MTSFKRGQIFIVSKIFAGISPPLFQLKNLLGKIEPGLYYKEQLTLTPKPKDSDYFLVNKVLHKKKIKGKVFYYCSFLYYPPSFNAYVSEKDLVTGPD